MISVEEVRKYNQECQKAQNTANQALAKKEVLETELQRLCETLTQMLGVPVTTENFEQVYESTSREIENLVRNGTELLQRAQNESNQMQQQTVQQNTQPVQQNTQSQPVQQITPQVASDFDVERAYGFNPEDNPQRQIPQPNTAGQNVQNGQGVQGGFNNNPWFAQQAANNQQNAQQQPAQQPAQQPVQQTTPFNGFGGFGANPGFVQQSGQDVVGQTRVPMGEFNSSKMIGTPIQGNNGVTQI